jgi:hypothetical protein
LDFEQMMALPRDDHDGHQAPEARLLRAHGRRNPLNGIIDVVAVRNVVLLSSDIAIGTAVDAVAHDGRTNSVIAALESR